MVAGVARSSLTGFDETVECGALCESFVRTGVGASDVGAYGHHLSLKALSKTFFFPTGVSSAHSRWLVLLASLAVGGF